MKTQFPLSKKPVLIGAVGLALVAGLLSCTVGTPTAEPMSTPTPAPADTLAPGPTSTMTPRTPAQENAPTPMVERTATEEPLADTGAVCPPGGGEGIAISPPAEGRSIVEMFEPQIMAYLNTRGDAQGLEATLNHLVLDNDGEVWNAAGYVHTVDVTGDAVPEVVVDLLFYVEGQYADGALFIFRCQAREYVGGAVMRIGGQLFADQEPEPVVRAIQDMNGDGTPEIVLAYITIIGTHANYTRAFRILEWNSDQFVDLIRSDGSNPHAAEVLNGDGVICDTDGDGIFELELTHGVGHGPEASTPEQTCTDVWAWDGEAFILAAVIDE